MHSPNELVVALLVDRRELQGDAAHRRRRTGELEGVGRSRCVVAQQNTGERAVPKSVALALEPGRIVYAGEPRRPPVTVRPSRVVDGRSPRTVEPAKQRYVTGPARLGAGTDGRPLPATERLALHDRPGDVPVDVGVAHLDPIQPPVDLVRIEALDAAREPIGHVVLQVDRVLEVVGPHHAEDRPEALGLVEPRPVADAEANAGTPGGAAGVELTRFDEPPLAALE